MKVKELFTAVAGALVGFFVAFQLVSSVYTAREAPAISHDTSTQALRDALHTSNSELFEKVGQARNGLTRVEKEVDNAITQLEETSKLIESENKAAIARAKSSDEKRASKPKPSPKVTPSAQRGSSPGLKFLKSARSPEMIAAVEKYPAEISTSGQVSTTCNDPPRPYRMMVTCQGTTYQEWQTRIMHYHWQKQSEVDPCNEMAGFMRLLSSKKGKSDGLEDQMDTIIVEELPMSVLAKYGFFGVLNRPHSVLSLLTQPELREKYDSIPEDYLFIGETDHVLMKPIPNLATETTPVAFDFGYMHASSSLDGIIKLVWPEGSWKDIQPIGPSPIIIHKKQLEIITKDWYDFSFALKSDPEADKRLGWVLEMWGYAIAAAKNGIKHLVLKEFQTEPGALSKNVPEDFYNNFYIYHYTYGIEYKMSGVPQGVNQIGEWSLDKRHYGNAYPPRHLSKPPNGANPSSYWLCNAFNEAMNGILDWPSTLALGTIGWRREKATDSEIAAHPVASKIVKTKWTWADHSGFEFNADGILKTPWGEGIWGLLPDEMAKEIGCLNCVFADFSGSLHNIDVEFENDKPVAFISRRVGDGQVVKGNIIV